MALTGLVQDRAVSTAVRIERVEPASAALWDRVAAASAGATFFHTRAWATALTNAYPFLRIATPAFHFADGTVAVLPLIERRWLGGLLRSYDSLTFGVYGGPIAETRLSQPHVEAMIESLGGLRTAKLALRGNPYAEWQLPPELPGEEVFTQSLDLRDGYEAVFHRFSRGNKSNISKARRAGLEVVLGETPEDYRAYYAAYEDSLRRWGEAAMIHYPLELFLALRESAGDAARLWLVKQGDEVVGGVLNFYHNRHAVYWHGAFVERYFEQRPSNLVHAEAIRDACERGFDWYDFNPSGPAPGVVRFKDSFHPEHLHYREAFLNGNPLFGAAASARGLAKRLLRRREL